MFTSQFSTETWFCNSKVLLIIIRTSIKRSNHENHFQPHPNVLYWISKFLNAPPDTQFITMFSPAEINSGFVRVSLKVLQFENPDSRKRNVFLNGLQVYKECCDTNNFIVCKLKHLFGSQNLLISCQSSTAKTITSRKS